MVLLILGDGDYMLFQKHVPPKVPKARNPVQLFKKKENSVIQVCQIPQIKNNDVWENH